MICCKHPDREAAGFCTYSGKPYCSEDLVEIDGKSYAKENLDRVFAEAREKSSRQSTPMVFMNAGGGGASSSSSSSAAASGGGRGGEIVVRRGINHALHIFLSFITAGLWLFVYIPLILFGRKETIIVRK